MLENLFHNTGRFGRGLLAGAMILASSYMGSCSTEVKVTNPDEIIIDTKHEGSVAGVVAKPYAENGRVVWKGVSGANVRIPRTSFEDRTTYGGWYSIDNLQDDNYAVIASLSGHNSDTVPALVEKQNKAIADTLKLTSRNSSDHILHGKVFYPNGSPAGNQEFQIWETNVSSLGGDRCSYIPTYPGNLVQTVRTTSDGNYAVQGMDDLVYTIYFKTSEGKRLSVRNTGKTCIENSGFELNKPINRRDLSIPN